MQETFFTGKGGGKDVDEIVKRLYADRKYEAGALTDLWMCLRHQSEEPVPVRREA